LLLVVLLLLPLLHLVLRLPILLLLLYCALYLLLLLLLLLLQLPFIALLLLLVRLLVLLLQLIPRLQLTLPLKLLHDLLLFELQLLLLHTLLLQPSCKSPGQLTVAANVTHRCGSSCQQLQHVCCLPVDSSMSYRQQYHRQLCNVCGSKPTLRETAQHLNGGLVICLTQGVQQDRQQGAPPVDTYVNAVLVGFSQARSVAAHTAAHAAASAATAPAAAAAGAS
jgi:hypothetical protein